MSHISFRSISSPWAFTSFSNSLQILSEIWLSPIASLSSSAEIVPFPSLSNLVNTLCRFCFDSSSSYSAVAVRNSLKLILPVPLAFTDFMMPLMSIDSRLAS